MRVLSVDAPDRRIVYCVAFTNAAADNIRDRLIRQNGTIPDNIKISTIHSFLYSELVRPYYHLLYGSKYKKISTISLPSTPSYRRARLSELESMQLLHQVAIPERAKWVVYGRAQDNARTKAMRAEVVAMFAGYCHKILVDEAQDIDKDIRDVLLALDHAGLDIELCGDPKQDVRGYGCFRDLVDTYLNNVSYSCECHRSPQLHLQVSNRLACEKEKQVADETNSIGSIDILFEADEDVNGLIASGEFGLAYISRKNDRFNTHENIDGDADFNSLQHELNVAIKEKHGGAMTELEVNRLAYYIAGQMIASARDDRTIRLAISKGINDGCYDYDAKRYARMAEALTVNDCTENNAIAVKSIEAIKGLEHEKCLFILTTDLAPYLLGDKTDDNKTKHILYVALTRSLDNLTVLVTKEVEARYTRQQIRDVFGAEAS